MEELMKDLTEDERSFIVNFSLDPCVNAGYCRLMGGKGTKSGKPERDGLYESLFNKGYFYKKGVFTEGRLYFATDKLLEIFKELEPLRNL
jgi:hypothetical protein